MAFDIPIRKSVPLDSRSLADKQGFMNVRQGLDRNSLNNDSFRKIPQTAPTPVRTQNAPVMQSEPTPVYTQNAPVMQSEPTPVHTQNAPVMQSESTPVRTQNAPVMQSESTPVRTQTAPVMQSESTPVRTQNAPVMQSEPTPVRTQNAPVMQSEPTPAKPQKKQRNIPAGNVFLQKGQKVSVDDSSVMKIALGWDILDARCEPDASAFMLGADGKVLGDEWFIFYGQDVSPDGSVKYSASQTGDDAVMYVDFGKINPAVQRIVFSVTIYEAVEKGLNFGMTENVYARIIDSKNNEAFRFQLDECYSNVTAMVLGELYRYKGKWKFNAVGSGVARDLAGFCAMYGVNLI